WSPDSARIAYTVEDAGAFIISLAGRGADRPTTASLTGASTVPGGSEESSPSPEPLARPEAGDPPFVPWSWSPDGTTIVGSMKGIVLYEIGPRRYRRLTGFGVKPVWLPDGQRLLFTDDRK